jgi:PAS domain S-box-containing protein
VGDAPFFDLALDLLAVAGRDGTVQRVNPACTSTLGWTSEQVLGRPYTDLFHPDDLDRARPHEVGAHETRLRCHDGSY